jgi:hypothetical protein
MLDDLFASGVTPCPGLVKLSADSDGDAQCQATNDYEDNAIDGTECEGNQPHWNSQQTDGRQQN